MKKLVLSIAATFLCALPLLGQTPCRTPYAMQKSTFSFCIPEGLIKKGTSVFGFPVLYVCDTDPAKNTFSLSVEDDPDNDLSFEKAALMTLWEQVTVRHNVLTKIESPKGRYMEQAIELFYERTDSPGSFSDLVKPSNERQVVAPTSGRTTLVQCLFLGADGKSKLILGFVFSADSAPDLALVDATIKSVTVRK